MKKLIGAACALALSSGVSFAQDMNVSASDLDGNSLSLSLAATYIDFNIANGGSGVISDGPFNFVRQADTESEFNNVGIRAQVGGTGRVALPFLGEQLLFGSYRLESAEEDRTSFGTTNNNNEFLDIIPITGQTSFDTLLAGPGAFVTDTETRFTRFESHSGIAQPIGTNGSYYGVGIVSALTLIDFRSDIFTPNFPNRFALLAEDVEVYSGGPTLTGKYNLNFANGMSAYVNGRVGVMYASADFEAEQSTSGNAVILRLESSENDIAFLGEIGGGVNFVDTGSFTLGLFGSAEVRDDVYEIVNPRSGPGLNVVNPVQFNGTDFARIEQTVQYSLSVGIKGVLRF